MVADRRQPVAHPFKGCQDRYFGESFLDYENLWRTIFRNIKSLKMKEILLKREFIKELHVQYMEKSDSTERFQLEGDFRKMSRSRRKSIIQKQDFPPEIFDFRSCVWESPQSRALTDQLVRSVLRARFRPLIQVSARMRCTEGQSPRFLLVFHYEYLAIGPLNAAPSLLVARSRPAQVPAGGREARATSTIPVFKTSYFKSQYKIQFSKDFNFIGEFQQYFAREIDS